MPRYSTTSLERLNTACIELQDTFRQVIQIYDNSILQGARGEDEQNHYFKTGKSKLRYPQSKHNITANRPKSLAVDAAPWPIDWDDLESFYYFGGLVVATGFALGHKIRWGGDWDMDGDLHDQTFMDLVHFEYHGSAVHTFIRST